MDHPEGTDSDRGYRVGFDRRVRVEFQGAQISSDGSLLVMRELDRIGAGLPAVSANASWCGWTLAQCAVRPDGVVVIRLAV